MTGAKILFVLPLFFLVTNCMQPQVPCLFIFGDSLSDSGNNNNMKTNAKSNYKPYGIDFPKGPTGRFTNGRTTIDIIGQFIGFKDFIPPFANTEGFDILKGVNYASGAAGILVETGKHMGARISLEIQITNHKRIVSQIAGKLGGSKKAVEYLNKCLYYVNIGNNDFINNYFLPKLYPTQNNYSPEIYAQNLTDKLFQYLQVLQVTGARKYVLVGPGLIGCIPNALSNQKNKGGCNKEMNDAALIYSAKLKSLVDQLNQNSSASKFIFINSTAGSTDPAPGFKVMNAGCCSTQKNGHCVHNKKPCKNRNEYVFWDEFHTTEAANKIIALSQYNASSPHFTYPMDIKHLLQS